MAGIKHTFQSALPDSSNPALVNPSNWNATHTIEETGALIGNGSTVTGVAAATAGQYFRRVRNSSSVSYAFQSGSDIVSTDYAFSQAIAQNLTGGVSAVITCNPLPEGIVAASVGKHYLYIVDAVAGNEAVLITAVAGATFTCTPALSHLSGNWTLISASNGIQEAVYVAGQGSQILIPAGSHTTYQQIFVPGAMNIRGADMYATVIYPTKTNANVFTCVWVSGTARICFSDFRVFCSVAMTAGAILYCEKYTDGQFCNLSFLQPYIGIDFYANNTGGGNPTITDNILINSCQEIGILHRSTGTGQTAGLISNYYCDGVNAICLRLDGIMAGYTITNLWFQSCRICIDIIMSGVAGMEGMISNFIFDQDASATAAIAAIRVTGISSTGTNGIGFHNGFIQTGVFGAIFLNTGNITMSSTRLNMRGAVAMIVLDGCSKSNFSENSYTVSLPAVARGFQLQNTCSEIAISGGESHFQTTVCPNEFINTQALITDVTLSGFKNRGFTTTVAEAVPGTVRMIGNDTNTAPPTVASAATIAIPSGLDQGGLFLITGTVNITRITGGYAGARYLVRTAGILTFATGGVNPGDISTSVTTAAGGMYAIAYNSTAGQWVIG